MEIGWPPPLDTVIENSNTVPGTFWPGAPHDSTASISRNRTRSFFDGIGNLSVTTGDANRDENPDALIGAVAICSFTPREKLHQGDRAAGGSDASYGTTQPQRRCNGANLARPAAAIVKGGGPIP